MQPDFLAELAAYAPIDMREAEEKDVILEYARRNADTVLTRENRVAHITGSAFVVNAAGDKTLMVHHIQRGVWAWPGGHADGNADLLSVALREAEEETGVAALRPLSPHIASLDVLHVHQHVKHGKWINTHLHLSVAYLLVADEAAPLAICPGENTAVAWFPIAQIDEAHFSPDDVYLYGKLAARARSLLGTI